MSRSSIILFSQFNGHLNSLNFTRKKMEKLFIEKQLVRRDIEQVYSGLFIDSITAFERNIENLFFGLLVKRLVHPSVSIVPRINVISDKIAQEVVNGNKKYLDWLPYETTKSRANTFFKNGAPFSSLLSADTSTIEEIMAIRNYLVHKSTHSRKQFINKVIGSLSVQPREKTPAGFLRGIKHITPTHQTRLEYYMIEMADIIKKLCST